MCPFGTRDGVLAHPAAAGAYRHGLIDGWLKDTVKNSPWQNLQADVFAHESPADPWWGDVTPKWSGTKQITHYNQSTSLAFFQNGAKKTLI